MTAQDWPADRRAAEKLDELATDAARSYRALAHNLDRALDLGRKGAVDPDRAVALAADLDRALAVDLDLAVALTRALAVDLDLDFNLDIDSGRALHLADILERVAATARTHSVQQDHDAPTDPAVRAASRWAVQLSATAVRLLPPAHRARFEEEFHAELDDLATSGTGRRAQLGHALRLLTRAGAHRRALRALHPGRERAR